MTAFEVGTATDTGMVRSNNQDSLLVVDDRLFAVADGMGGHRGGATASRVALEVLERALTEPTTDRLVESVREANRAVFTQSAEDPDLRGMGTTLCAIALVDDDGEEMLALVNVGDSRVYRFRDGELEQLTEDHSLVERLVKEGRLTPDEAETHPQRNILTRALGIDAEVSVDSWVLPPVPEDRYLLCSDGLFNEVDSGVISATLRRLADPEEAAKELVRLANEGGGRDNITCVVVDVTEGKSGLLGRRLGKRSRAGFETAEAPSAERELHYFSTDDAPEDDGDEPTRKEKGPRRITWRVLLFVVALIAVIGGTFAAVGWYARNTYYVGFRDDRVAIFQGRPDGLLWFDPTLERVFDDIPREDVPESVRDDLDAGQEEPSLRAAERRVENLREQIAAAEERAGDDRPAGDERPPTTTTTTKPA